MKKVLFGLLSVVSLAGLVACGDPVNSASDVTGTSETDATMDTGVDQAMPEEAPAVEEMPPEAAEVSDSDLEMTIQENLATLYPDTSFEVTSEAGDVTIAGEIPSQEEADYIAEWVTEMEGVNNVNVLPTEAETEAEELP